MLSVFPDIMDEQRTSIKPNSITVIPLTAARVRRRRTAESPRDTRAPPARPPAGARLLERPQRLHLAGWGGERRLGRHPRRACFRAPTPTAGLSLRPNGAAQRELPGIPRPAPRAWFQVGPKFRSPCHRGPDKMENVVSSRSHNGRWGHCSPPG